MKIVTISECCFVSSEFNRRASKLLAQLFWVEGSNRVWIYGKDRDFRLFHVAWTESEPAQPPIQWIFGAVYPKLKLPSPETGRSPSFSVEVNNLYFVDLQSLPVIFMDWNLIKLDLCIIRAGTRPDKMGQALKFLTWFQEVSGSNCGPDTDCLDQIFRVLSQILHAIAGEYLKLVNDFFLPDPFWFII